MLTAAAISITSALGVVRSYVYHNYIYILVDAYVQGRIAANVPALEIA